ncbi:MAG: hypothetical protein JWM68_3566, partial [Verrucomicrobiales bacterium]|nr:hypothetical protein [Verrucomicrobiales bacterium]
MKSLPLIVCLFFKILFARADNWDSRFATPPQTDGTLTTIVASGNELYAGGEFSTIEGVHADNIAKWNGTTWEALDSGVDGPVYAIAINGASVYVGGAFRNAGGVDVTNIAIWNGQDWATVGTGLDNENGDAAVLSLAAAGSVVYAGGVFDSAGAVGTTNIAKWNGSAWSALGKGLHYASTNLDQFAEASVSALALSGSILYVGGVFTQAGNAAATNVAKWNAAGWSALGDGLDYVPEFSDDFETAFVTSLAVNGSTLYAGGFFNTSGSTNILNLAKWSGSTWSSVGGEINSTVQSVITNGSDIYIAGDFSSVDDLPLAGVAHWNGTNWESVGNGLQGEVLALCLAGKNIFAAGNLGGEEQNTPSNISQWNGIAWSTPTHFIPISPDGVIQEVIRNGTNIIVGGSFENAGTVAAANVAKWTGTNWQSFGSGLNGPVYALAASGSNLYAGGSFTLPGGTNVARWTGFNWQTLDSGFDDVVTSLVSSGTNLFAAGAFLNAGAQAVNHVASWNGTQWSNLGSGIDGAVYTLASNGTKLLAGGEFTDASGIAVNNLAQWNGTSWSAFANVSGPVYASTLINQTLFIGGAFTNVGGVSVNNVARWDGAAWSDLGGGVDGPVLALDFDGTNLFVTGQFSMAGTNNAANIAKWNGSNWTPLGEGLDTPASAVAILGTDVFAGGDFVLAGEQDSFHFGIWHDATPFIWHQPEVADVFSLGSDLSLSVTALGAAPLQYQWRLNGLALAGATNSIYSRTNLQSSDLGIYSVKVSNAFGTALSDDVFVQQSGYTVFYDGFESGNLTNWSTVPGATTLTVSSVQKATGNFSALCTNSANKIFHNLLPDVQGHARATYWIYDDGGTQNRWLGEIRSYTGAGYGGGTLQEILGIGSYNANFGTNNTGDLAGETVIATNYQGHVLRGDDSGYFNLNDPAEPGRTNGWHCFQIERLQDEATVDFFVDGEFRRETYGATNTSWDSLSIGSMGSGAVMGNVWFDDVRIEYLDPPTITKDPVSKSVNANSSATFSVVATGNIRTYQWLRDGIALAGATASSLTVSNVQASSTGTYQAIVGNGVGAQASGEATLTLNTRPIILLQPQNQNGPAGTNIALRVVATGEPSDLSYQWRRNGTNVAGANTSEFVFLNAQTNISGPYSV